MGHLTAVPVPLKVYIPRDPSRGDSISHSAEVQLEKGLTQDSGFLVLFHGDRVKPILM